MKKIINFTFMILLISNFCYSKDQIKLHLDLSLRGHFEEIFIILTDDNLVRSDSTTLQVYHDNGSIAGDSLVIKNSSQYIVFMRYNNSEITLSNSIYIISLKNNVIEKEELLKYPKSSSGSTLFFRAGITLFPDGNFDYKTTGRNFNFNLGVRFIKKYGFSLEYNLISSFDKYPDEIPSDNSRSYLSFTDININYFKDNCKIDNLLFEIIPHIGIGYVSLLKNTDTIYFPTGLSLKFKSSNLTSYLDFKFIPIMGDLDEIVSGNFIVIFSTGIYFFNINGT